MSPTIRDQILEYLHQNQRATVSELAVALHITRQDIRYNLRYLLTEKLIEKFDYKGRDGGRSRGRPPTSLRLTSKSRPNNYATLVTGLFRNFLEQTSKNPDMVVRQLMKLVFKSTDVSSSSARQVIDELTDRLCSYEYKAHWEAHAAGPRIIFENCPYAEIIEEFPQLCSMDREFITQFTGMKAELLQRFDSFLRKPPACIFKLAI